MILTSADQGYTASFAIALDWSDADTGQSASNGGGGPGGLPCLVARLPSAAHPRRPGLGNKD